MAFRVGYRPRGGYGEESLMMPNRQLETRPMVGQARESTVWIRPDPPDVRPIPELAVWHPSDVFLQ